MSIFESFFFSVFSYYKTRYKKQANAIAVFHTSFLQAAIILLLGVFFSIFFDQMNTSTMSSSKAWTLFILTSIAVYFINWVKYSGKKRKVLNAKMNKNKSQQHRIWVLWLLPFACVFISLLLLRVF